MEDLKKAFLEGAKEFARIFLLGVISYLLTAGVSALATYLAGVHVPQIVILEVTGAITAGLKAVDEWIHEWGKSTDNQNMIKGLTRF